MRVLFSLLVFTILCPLLVNGQNLISKKVQEASFQKSAQLFTLTKQQQSDLHAVGIPEEELGSGATFSPDLEAIRELKKSQPELLDISIDLPGIGIKELTLIPNKVLADDFILRTSTGNVVDYTPGLYYYGIIKGDQNSIVALSVFNNELHGIINTTKGNFVIAKLDNRKDNKHIIFNDKELKQPFELDCGTADDGIVYRPEDLVEPSAISKTTGDCIRVYVEIDDDIVTNKGGVNNSANYITGLFNESTTLYANEGINLVISEILAWDNFAPYSSSSASGMLADFQNNTGTFNGDLAHLVSYQASGGIAAGFSGICNPNPDNSKCFSNISSSYSNVPTYSYSVMVVTHEMGHLIGSRHTHACVWNGNGTAIDGCAGRTEGSCSLPGNPINGGTIMSYCHLATGIDFTQGFGPQPGAVIRNTIANSNCTSPCGNGPTCDDGVQNGDETGVDCGGSCAPCSQGCTDNLVTITISTDNYGRETSWTLTNSSGATVASGNSYDKNTTYTETLCLPNGCYEFTINDSYGDGMCCSYGNGSYSVTSDGTTYASGGSFDDSETTGFCLTAAVTPTCSDGIQNGDETGVDCGGSCTPCSQGCTDNELVVTISTDNYGSETSWTLTNSSGSTVASGSSYGNNTTYTETLCLPNGCYDFTINDRYGDGMCCSYGNGSYSVTSGSTTYASGGSFGRSETTEVCLWRNAMNFEEQGLDSDQTNITTDNKLILFPNPAKDVLQVRSQQEINSVNILSATGQLIKTINVEAKQLTIDIADLKAGIYYIMSNSNETMSPQRFVKQ